MRSYEVLLLVAKLIPLAFAFAFGACIGSLINVIVYRMPRGIGIVSPPSACPACGTHLTWRENIPVLGWVLLRGRCRFCRSRISAEYPIVEAAVGLLIAGFFGLWYLTPPDAHWAWIGWGSIRPAWAGGGFTATWPLFVVLVVLLGSLAAMTLVDAKTTMIPLGLAWFPTAVALVGYTGFAAWLEYAGAGGLSRSETGYAWSIPTPGPADWGWIAASIGGIVGIGLGNVLLATGLIHRSFEGYEAWERETYGGDSGAAQEERGKADKPDAPATGDGRRSEPGPAPREGFWRAVGAALLAVVVLGVVGGVTAGVFGLNPWVGAGPGVLLGPIVGGLFTRRLWPRVKSRSEGQPSSQAEVWILYPHARREMVRELAFVAPCVLLAWVGWKVGPMLGGTGISATLASLWVRVLAGVLTGYLVGGGIVWGARILGTLAFGKEAMGLGDVHLLAAVGACLGWIDPTLAFFVFAPFVGLYGVLLMWAWAGSGSRALPYGPSLAVGTVLVLLGKPLIVAGLNLLMRGAAPIAIP